MKVSPCSLAFLFQYKSSAGLWTPGLIAVKFNDKPNWHFIYISYFEAPACRRFPGDPYPEEMQDHVGAHLPHLIHVTGGQARPSHLHFCIQSRQVEADAPPSPALPETGFRKDTRKRDWANDVLWEDLPFAEGRTRPPLAFLRVGSFPPRLA